MDRTGAPALRLNPDLPIFAVAVEGGVALYAPGHLVPVGEADWEAMRSAVSRGELGALRRPLAGALAGLRQRAREAVDRWNALAARPFSPGRLFAYPSNRCDHHCTYCYTAPARASAGLVDSLSPDMVELAALHVAKSCRAHGGVLRAVLHGGGEPTMDLERLSEHVRRIRLAAEQAGVPSRLGLATNGALCSARAGRIATLVDHVTLSCDGPPDVQRAQRPGPDGVPSTEQMRRTVHLFREEGVALRVRATITPSTLERQPEIAAYLAGELGVPVLRFETAYRVGSLAPWFGPEEAGAFVSAFLRAQAAAAEMGGTLSFAGVRLDDLHGPFCPVAGDALLLTPRGSIAGCFFAPIGAAPDVGWVEPGGRGLILDTERLAAHRARAFAVPERCRSCVCLFHCARECPEACVGGSGAPALDRPPGFRCLVARGLAMAWIREAAASVRRPGLVSGGEPDVFQPAPDLGAAPAVARADLSRERLASSPRLRHGRRALPAPELDRLGLEQRGEESWRELAEEARKGRGPISVYVHVPLCEHRCGFCDCRSVVRSDKRELRLMTRMREELARWAEAACLSGRPVTTVHFGGGTPNVLPAASLAELLAGVAGVLDTGPRTEWALESTGSLLGQEHVRELRELGFERLHVGVQTLDDELRRRIGRRQSGLEVLAALERALGGGFVLSVDLLIGLPGQTPAELVRTVGLLVGIGVHGVSVYSLQRSHRNRAFQLRERAEEPDPIRERALFQRAHDLLEGGGYSKNHFSHFARGPDRNLYYTHRARGEDRLGLGPTADGCFGAYVYRNLGVRPYLEGGRAPLLGGRRLPAAELATRGVVDALMAARLPLSMLRAAGLEALGEGWVDEGLARVTGDALTLTASGSWLVDQMISDVRSGRA